LAAGLLALLVLVVAAVGLVAALDGADRRQPATGGPAEERNARVTRVVDGDTLVALVDGVEERVRLLGIDTPEMSRHDRRGEYLAVEATECARELAQGREVLLSGDPRRKDRDDYGRLLRYVRLPDGRLLNAELLRRGYARVFTRYDFGRMDEFLALEAEARGKGIGLWTAGGLAEVEWKIEQGMAPVRLHATTNWSWAIEYEGWIKTGVPARDLVRELGRVRRVVERGDPSSLADRLRDEGYVALSRAGR
jgi:micrococcal nuclease